MLMTFVGCRADNAHLATWKSPIWPVLKSKKELIRDPMLVQNPSLILKTTYMYG